MINFFQEYLIQDFGQFIAKISVTYILLKVFVLMFNYCALKYQLRKCKERIITNMPLDSTTAKYATCSNFFIKEIEEIKIFPFFTHLYEARKGLTFLIYELESHIGKAGKAAEETVDKIKKFKL